MSVYATCRFSVKWRLAIRIIHRIESVTKLHEEVPASFPLLPIVPTELKSDPFGLVFIMIPGSCRWVSQLPRPCD